MQAKRIHRRATLAVLLTALAFPAGAAAAAQGGYPTTPGQRGPAFTDHGIVQRNPRVVLVFWGWTGTPFQEQVLQAEQTMFGEMAWSEWGQILVQYGVRDDTRLEATVTDPVQPPSRALHRRDFAAEVLRAQRLAGLADTFDTQWVVLPSDAANPYLPQHFSGCGEHDGFNVDHHRYNYDIIPSFDAPPYSDGCLGGLSAVQSTTNATSHEFAEDATNPLILHNDGWWLAFGRGGDQLQEIADICDGQSVVPPGMSVVMQAVWSNASEGPRRDRGCVVSAAGGVPGRTGEPPAGGPAL